MLLKNKCSIEYLNYFHNKHNFTKSPTYYYSIATSTKQLNWLKQNHFRYSSNFEKYVKKKLNKKWMEKNFGSTYQKLLAQKKHLKNQP